MLIFVFNAEATEKFNVTTPEGFYVYSEQPSKVADILKKPEDELSSYVADNFINYLGVNEDNSKQIKISSYTTDFSNSIVNLSYLKDDNINSIIPEISGLQGVRGDIVTKDGQKFILLNLKSDNGYILTQYITVANKKTVILSFNTDINTDTDYTKTVFEDFICDDFVSQKTAEKTDAKAYIILAAAIIFGILTIIIIISLIKEIKQKNG